MASKSATYEQPPVQKGSKDPNTVEVRIQRTGDDMIDASTKALYENLGYTFKEESSLGTVTMQCPRDVHEARQQQAIIDHRKREKMNFANKAEAPGTTEVAEVVERANRPVRAEELAGTPTNLVQDEPDFDEL